MCFEKKFKPKSEEIEVAEEVVTRAPNCRDFENIGTPYDNAIGIAADKGLSPLNISLFQNPIKNWPSIHLKSRLTHFSANYANYAISTNQQITVYICHSKYLSRPTSQHIV